MSWSQYQENIFSFIENPCVSEFNPLGKTNAIIKAVAGSGKSTTIVECTKRLPRVQGTGNLAGMQQASYVMLAFNKSIAEELKAKGVNARTFHSLTYGPVTKARAVNTVESNKMWTVCKQNMPADDNYIYGNFVSRLVGLAKQSGFGCLIKDTVQDWRDMINHHSLEIENENGDEETAIEYAIQILEASYKSNLLDFDDLLYNCVRDNLKLPQYNYVFVDEGQDTNAIQRAIIRKILAPGGRLIVVGDEKQAIYGFRGADSESLNLLRDEFDCIELPLTVSYRCATNVVKYAQTWVPYVEAAPNAPDGQVVDMKDYPLSKLIKDTSESAAWAFGPNDLMVCRTTKPLVEFAYRCLRQKMPVKILGREIGQGLKALIAKMNAKDVDELEKKLQVWAMREVDKAIEKNLLSKAESVQDKADSILCLIQTLPEDDESAEGDEKTATGVRTINALLDVIESLFNPAIAAMTLATIHKAKGMEADRVWWLNSSKQPARWAARKEWQLQQELNLCYVAATRAKTTLILIEDGSNQNQVKSDLRAPSHFEQAVKEIEDGPPF